jgi:hydroxyethylthiazole kinase-like uncharacterized protein yjeF
MDNILSLEEMRAAETAVIAAGASEWGLISHVGEEIARLIRARFPDGAIVALCGPGKNGADALAAAEALRRAGRHVRVLELAGEGAPERKRARADYGGDVEPLAVFDPGGEEVVIDGLFGAGLNRPLAGVPDQVRETLAASGARLISVDLPSGLHGDAARPLGAAFRADLTVVCGAFRKAHVLWPAAGHCGELALVPLGLPLRDGPGSARLNGPGVWGRRMIWPSETTHKHQRGHLAVVSGPAHATGAARLAASAGLRAGAGLVTILCPPEALAVCASDVRAVMTRPVSTVDEVVAACQGCRAVIVGPAAGVGARTAAIVERLAAAGARLVIDADALSSFAGRPDDLRCILSPGAVLTPHEGEFRKVFGDLADGADKIERARRAAAAAGAVIVLKGPDTVIAAPDGAVLVNRNAVPFLATAGAGDVLAGVIGALIAQGLAPYDAAAAGVWMHAEAGRRLGPALIADEIETALRGVIAELYAVHGARPA